MHEMALCRSIVEIVAEHAARAGCARVRAVRLEIGALSHVAPEALAFGFDAASRGTVAEGARLDIDRPPGRAWCMGCSTEVTVESRADPCPRCGSHQLMVLGGDEMRVKELEGD